MEYIVISILATIPMIFLLYIVANKFFHIYLQIKTLLLCAACALLISLMVPRIIIGYTGMLGTMAVIIMLAVIFASYMAYYDDQQEKKQSDNVIVKNSLPASAAQELLTTNEKTIINNNQVRAEEIVVVEEVVVVVEVVVNPLELIPPAIAPVLFLNDEVQNATELEIAEEEIKKNNLSKQQNLNQEETLEFREPVVVAEKIVDMPILENYATADEANDDQPEAVSAEQNAVTISLNDHLTEEYHEETVEAEVEPSVTTIGETAASPSVTVSLEDEDNSTPKSDELDDLLDYAFEQKEQHNYSQALQAFQKALDLYHKSAVAPFLIVEIATIFKNCGAYDEAIKIFCYGRTLPELSKNLHLDKEFANSIAYLRITKNILLEENLGSLPFNEISAIIRNKIDSTFAEEQTNL